MQESCYFSNVQPRLIQQQSQKLVLSPQIRQYLKLLQLPIADLQQAVEVEMETNPLIEETPKDGLEDPLETPAGEEKKENPSPETRELAPVNRSRPLTAWMRAIWIPTTPWIRHGWTPRIWKRGANFRKTF